VNTRLNLALALATTLATPALAGEPSAIVQTAALIMMTKGISCLPVGISMVCTVKGGRVSILSDSPLLKGLCDGKYLTKTFDGQVLNVCIK
jgi:hypothetical protein